MNNHEQVIELLEKLYNKADAKSLLSHVETIGWHPRDLDCTKTGENIRPLLNPREDVTDADYLNGRVRQHFAKQVWKENIQEISSAVAKRFQILLDQTVTHANQTWICVYAAECSRDYEIKVMLKSLQKDRLFRVYVNIFELHLCHFLWDRVVELENFKNHEKKEFD